MGLTRIFIQARALAAELIAQAKDAAESSGGTTKSNGAFKVPPDIRKSKMAGVESLLDREYVLSESLSLFDIVVLMLTTFPIQESPRGRSGREAGAFEAFRVYMSLDALTRLGVFFSVHR